MDLSFKLADVADIDRLVEFMQEFYEVEHLTYDDQAARAALQRILNDDSFGKIWLIQLNEIAIGYVVLTLGFSLEFRGRDALIDEIYLRADYRGRGIGRRALEFVGDACRSLGVQALHLEVERKNTSAQALYRKCGFVDHDRYLLTKWIAS